MVRCVVLMILGMSVVQAQVAAVHGGGAEVTLDASRVRDIFLGRITTWSDGTPVVLVLAEDAEADATLAKLVGRNRERLLRGWKRLVYSGGGAMPLQASSQHEALEMVARHPGSITILPHVSTDPRWRTIVVQEH